MIIMVCPKCGSELDALVYTTYPPVHAYRCRNCGWEYEERANITQVPAKTVERKPQTNADRIRQMSDEELTKLFVSGWFDGPLFICPVKDVECESNVSCDVCFLEWLKSQVEPGEVQDGA